MMNIGRIIQKGAAAILAVAVILALVILLIEIVNVGVWDFGSLEVLVLSEILILVCGFVIFALLYGFGEIIICVQDIRDIVDNL